MATNLDAVKAAAAIVEAQGMVEATVVEASAPTDTKATVPPGSTQIIVDRHDVAHAKILCMSYIFNVGIGNGRRHDLFPGNSLAIAVGALLTN